MLDSRFLERRRRELGMTRAQLAERSGVSAPTVTRILTGNLEKATFRNVRAVVEALGIELAPKATEACDFQEQAAEAQAKKIVALVQGSSALEAQAVDDDTTRQMIKRTVHELMAGSRRRLWTTI